MVGRRAGCARKTTWAQRARPDGSGSVERRPAGTHPPEPRQPQGEVVEIEAGIEPEQVELDALAPAGGHAKQAVDGELPARAARGCREVVAPGQPVLADGRRRQVEPQLRHLAPHPGDERVAVRAGPGPVALAM